MFSETPLVVTIPMLREETNQRIAYSLFNDLGKDASKMNAAIMFGVINGILLIHEDRPSGFVKNPPAQNGKRNRKDRRKFFENAGLYLVRTRSGINIDSGKIIQHIPGPDRDERLLAI